MPLPLIIAIPVVSRPVGNTAIPSTAVPTGAISMTVDLDFTAWTNPVATLTIALERSEDGGVTWVPAGGLFGLHPNASGQFVGRSGQVLTHGGVFVTWPPNTTHLRGTVTISGASIVTGGTVTVN
jgi:hypothetical protein